MTLKKITPFDLEDFLKNKFEDLEKRNKIQFDNLSKQLDKADEKIEELTKSLNLLTLAENSHVIKCPNMEPIRRMQEACSKYPSAEAVDTLIDEIKDTSMIKKYYKVFGSAFILWMFSTVTILFVAAEKYSSLVNTVRVNTGIIREQEKEKSVKDYILQQQEIKDMNK
jgi:hypothetical protein